MILVTVEAADTQNASILSAKFKRRFSGNPRSVVLDVQDDTCPYSRSARIFDALRGVDHSAEFVFCPVPFYRFSGCKATWLELVNRLASSHGVAITHVMLFVFGDSHEMLDEYLDRGVASHGSRTLEDALDFAHDSEKTFSAPLGHPFPYRNFRYEVPRFAADVPALLESLFERMVADVESLRRK